MHSLLATNVSVPKKEAVHSAAMVRTEEYLMVSTHTNA